MNQPIDLTNQIPFDLFDHEVAAPLGGGAPKPFPFEIIQVSPTSVKVRYGTVANLEPAGVGTTIDCSANGTRYIYLDCTINAAGLVTAVAVATNTTGLPAQTSTNGYVLIGNVVTVDGEISEINQAVMFSMGFAACARNEDDPATTPGTYHWFVGSSGGAPGGGGGGPPPP